MAQTVYRANVHAEEFPLDIKDQSQTVIIQGYDNTFNRTISSHIDTTRDAGVPQVCHVTNALPTADGYTSIHAHLGLQTFSPPYALTNISYLGFVNYRNGGVGQFILGVGPANETVLRSISGLGAGEIELIIPGNLGASVYATTINGVTYFFVPGGGGGLYAITAGTPYTVTSIAVSGIVVTSMLAMASLNGYLLFFDSKTVYWSGTSNVLDFVPSLASGAGSMALQDISGNIYTAKEATTFVLVLSQGAALSLTATNQQTRPFIARLIPKLNTTSSANQVVDFDSVKSVVHGEDSLMYVTASAAAPLNTSMIKGKQVTYSELLPPLANPFLRHYAGFFKLESIADALLFVCYNDSNNESGQKLVLNQKLNRWGRLHIPQCAAIIKMDLYGFIGVTNYGTYLYCNYANSPDGANPLDNQTSICFGKFQLSRSSKQCVDTITVGNVAETTAVFVVGYNRSGTPIFNELGVIIESDTTSGTPLATRTYGFSGIACDSFIVTIDGKFDLNTLIIRMHQSGRD